jgi:hypothetical protein
VCKTRFGQSGEEIKLWPLSGIKPRSIDRPARSIVTISTELSRFHKAQNINDKEVTKLQPS